MEALIFLIQIPPRLQIGLLLERHFRRLHGHLVGREGGEDGGRQPRGRHALSCPFLKELIHHRSMA